MLRRPVNLETLKHLRYGRNSERYTIGIISRCCARRTTKCYFEKECTHLYDARLVWPLKKEKHVARPRLPERAELPQILTCGMTGGLGALLRALGRSN
jgi:hypothetical protein